MTKKEERELGFGKKSGNARFINKDGSINVVRKGLPLFRPYDTYHWLITIGWGKFIFYLTLSFFIINSLFAGLYLICGAEGITAVDVTSPFVKFWEAFFFSVQTITTVGFGYFSPESTAVKIVSSIESFFGLMGFALATGILYGRFSRPVAKILYANKAIITKHKGKDAFMFKMANQRSSKLIEAEVSLVFSGIDKQSGNRIFTRMELELKKINFFALSWTVVHVIDESSPLWNMDKSAVDDSEGEFIILVKAFDDTFSQTIYSRFSYKYYDLDWGVKYVSSIHATEDGRMSMDLTKLHDTEKLD